MVLKPNLVLPVCLFGVFILWITGSTATGVLIPNLNESCYRCLCHVSTECDMTHGCTAGYCGPFNISRIYWREAGEVVLPDDDPERINAWKDCAKNYHCAKRIIENYLAQYAMDCNSDGLINCFDYMMINAKGGYYGCTTPLNESEKGRRWLERYQDCGL